MDLKILNKKKMDLEILNKKNIDLEILNKKNIDLEILNKNAIGYYVKHNLDEFYDFNGKTTLGASSGLKTVDQLIEGFFGVTGLTGVPGRGKTTFAMQTVCYNVFVLKQPAIYITLEVNKQMFITKIVSFLTQIPVKKILKGGLTLEESKKFLEAFRKVYHNENLILLGEKEANFNNIEKEIDKCKDIFLKQGKEINPLVILDYLNIFYDYGKDSKGLTDIKDKISKQMTEFIRIKNETKANFIIIAAKNKQGYKTAEMSSLKGSNDLEYGFETIISLEDVAEDFPIANYPPNPTTGFVEVNTLMYVMKNRWGESKKQIPLYFSGKESRFTEPF